MNRRTSIVNISGDHEETLIQLAKHLGASKFRRKIFNAIYGRGTRPRSKKQVMEAAGISAGGTNPQQAQNELNYLSAHHLIVKLENDGSVKDGSRILYGKDDTVRAHRKKIVKFADNPEVASQIPTKRRPVVHGITSVRRVSRQALSKRKQLAVLYLTANPDENSPLRIDAEIKAVQEAIRRSNFRDHITINYRPAADLQSLLNGLNDHRPKIVHFSGHGHSGGITTDAGDSSQAELSEVSFRLLAQALAATDNPPEIIVLNSCESSGAISDLIPPAKVVITMRETITDIAASAFAVQFYAAIASGQSVKASFDQGKLAVEIASITEFDTPELAYSPDVNPGSMVLT